MPELTLEQEARLKTWIQTQHGSAGWQEKLANLFTQEIDRAVKEALTHQKQ